MVKKVLASKPGKPMAAMAGKSSRKVAVPKKMAKMPKMSKKGY